jgi:2-dehydro-3-deoxyglucarate aldolase/4-hydroxy-2-oxoheptanedioate aldolase
MRANPLKSRLAEGGSAFGTMAFEFFTPGLPAICRASGAEFIIYDMEHSGVSFETIKAQIASCKGADIQPFVRLPHDDYHFIARALDVGATGIMIPMVETPEQAGAIVACTRYPPAGRRGAAFNVAAHDDYTMGGVAEKIAAAHARTLVICLVETAAGMENVDAIAAVDGVDVLWLGHFDLTSSMGIAAQFDHPRFLSAVDALLAACAKHGKCPGFLAGDEKWVKDYRAKGFRMLCYGTDVTLLQGALAQGMEALGKG